MVVQFRPAFEGVCECCNGSFPLHDLTDAGRKTWCRTCLRGCDQRDESGHLLRCASVRSWATTCCSSEAVCSNPSRPITDEEMAYLRQSLGEAEHSSPTTTPPAFPTSVLRSTSPEEGL